MVVSPVKSSLTESVVDKPAIAQSQVFTLEDFLANPPENMEWVDGELVEKTGMTVKHSAVQGRLVHSIRNHLDVIGQGGEACPEAPCRTLRQARRPDVAYIPASLMAEVGQATVSPKVFPFIAEIASPDDSAEGLFSKALEYIEAGCQEVWVLFPQAQLIMTKTVEQPWSLFNLGEKVSSQAALPGFQVRVDELLL